MLYRRTLVVEWDLFWLYISFFFLNSERMINKCDKTDAQNIQQMDVMAQTEAIKRRGAKFRCTRRHASAHTQTNQHTHTHTQTNSQTNTHPLKRFGVSTKTVWGERTVSVGRSVHHWNRATKQVFLRLSEQHMGPLETTALIVFTNWPYTDS